MVVEVVGRRHVVVEIAETLLLVVHGRAVVGHVGPVPAHRFIGAL